MERFFVSRPIFAIVLAVVIVLGGLLSIRHLAIEEYPDITPPVVEVTATYEGADALTVDDAVATPVGQSIMGVEDMLYMQSTSSNAGSMTLEVTFDIGSDPDLDAIFTQNNAASATPLLPASVTRQGVTTRKAETGFLTVYSLYSDGRYDDEFLSNYAYIHLQNELLKINGVGKVEVMGAGPYSMRVWVRPDILHYYNLTVREITAAIEAQSGIYPAGQLGAEPTSAATEFTYTVTMPPQITTADAYERIVLRTRPDGSQIRLGDVASVELGSESYGVSSTFNRFPAAMISIYQTPGSNAVKVGTAVKRTIQRLQERFPDGISLATVVDTTQSIRAGVHEIFLTLLLALVLVVAIIFLFLQDWRSTLVPLVAIPVSLVGAFIAFPLLGFSINIISLLGLILAIGLVVDDGIVVVEAVQVHIARGLAPREATLEAMRTVASPIVATTVVLLAVFIPVSFTGGITGRMFQQFAVTISVAVVLSAFNALTLSPALCALLLRERKAATHGFFGAFNRWFSRRMQGYDRLSTRITRHTGRTMLFVGAVVAAIVVLWRATPGGFLPEEDQGYLMVMVDLPPAASLSRTERVLGAVEQIVGRHPAVRYTASAAGFNMMAGIASTSSGILFVTLKGYADRRVSAMQLAEQLNSELYAEVNAAEAYAFTPPSIPGLGLTSGITFEVQDLTGKGIAYLDAAVHRLLDTLARSPELASATTPFRTDVPERHLRIDRDYALREGVDLDALYDQLATFLGGAYIGNFNRFGKLYQSTIQAAPEYRQDRSALGSYFVQNGRGESVPVAAFVEVIDTTGVEYLSQFNLYRSIAVTAAPARGTSSRRAMALIEERAQELLPPDVALAWSGVSYQERSAQKGTGLAYGLAVLFVFLSLAALYNSWGLPIAILLSVPFAVLGALGAVFLWHLWDPLIIRDLFLEISLVMLIGLAAKNAILVVEYAQHLFYDEHRSLFDAAMEAARLRVRPILMTAFAFVLGVAPLVFAHGAYATARNTMGVALVGGMLVATLVGIFLYPALYYAVGRASGMEKKRQKMLVAHETPSLPAADR